MTAGLSPDEAVAARRPVPSQVGGGSTGAAEGDKGLWIVLGLLVAYSAIHIGFRLLASSALGEDDPLENLVVQDLRAIYDPRRPPLYDWLLYAAQSVIGPTIVSFLAIKYAALVGTGAALYAIARRSFGAGIAALLAVESLALIYQLSWRFHEGYTHQVGAMLAVAVAMWALLRTVDAPSPGNFALLGGTAAIGTLTQPVFLVFAVALGIAATAERDVRVHFTAARLTLTALPMIVTLGVLFWLMTRDDAGSPFVPVPAAAFSVEWPGWPLIWGGFLNALRAPLFYLSPLILIVPLLFHGFAARAWADIVLVAGRAPPAAARDEYAPGLHERIVLRAALAGFGLSLIGAAALGLKGYSSHVFMPLYLTSVVWIMGAVRRTVPTQAALTRFGRLALAIAVVALVGRLANMFVLDPVCKICRWGIPYAGLAAELARAGAGRGLIVAVDHETGGNLRSVLPDATVVLAGGRPMLREKPDGRAAPSLAVWRAALPDAAAAQALSPYLQPGQSIAAATVVRVPWRHLWRPDGYRFSEWKYLVIDRAALPINRVP